MISFICCPQFISSLKISKWQRQLQDRWWFLRRWWHWRVGGCWSWWHWGRWQTRGWRNLIRWIGVIIKIPSTWDQKLTGLGGAGTIAGGGGLATALPPLGSESLKLNCRKNSLVSLRRKGRNVLIEKSNCLGKPSIVKKRFFVKSLHKMGTPPPSHFYEVPIYFFCTKNFNEKKMIWKGVWRVFSPQNVKKTWLEKHLEK